MSYKYDAYGNIVNMSGNTTLGTLNPMQYRSYYYDEESGFYYLQSRYYDPQMGRFINADEADILELTSSDINGANLYSYCGNDPVNNVDYNGCFVVRRWMIALVIDAIMSFTTLSAAFMPVKAIGKYFGKKTLQSKIRRAITKVWSIFRSSGNKFLKFTINFLKKCSFLSNLTIKKVSNYLSGFISGLIGSSLLNTILNFSIDYIECFTSVGGFIALCLDYKNDKRINDNILSF